MTTGRREFLRELAGSAAAFWMTAACTELLGPPRRRPISFGAFVFTGFEDPRSDFGLVPGIQCPQEHPWAGFRTNDRFPAIGQYNEAEPRVTAWRLEQMRRGGINWVTYQHEWSPNLAHLLMNHCAENHPDDADIQYAFSWWDVLSSPDGSPYYADPLWTTATIIQSLEAYSSAIYPFTRKASYLHVDDRPVLFRGAAQTLPFYQRWGISPRQVLDLISSAFPVRPYFVATGATRDVDGLLKPWGFDAFTAYLLYADSWQNAARTYRDYWRSSIAFARKSGLDFWVPAAAGYDNRAFFAPQGDQVFMPTPAEFTAHLREAREVADMNYAVTRGMVCTYAWNEEFEGGVLEPMMPGMLHDGDEMLLAHAAVAKRAA